MTVGQRGPAGLRVLVSSFDDSFSIGTKAAAAAAAASVR